MVETEEFFLLGLKVINPFRTKTPKYLLPRENEPLLYYQIGNKNFFIFITSKT